MVERILLRFFVLNKPDKLELNMLKAMIIKSSQNEPNIESSS